jgi:hypothetical protein
MISKILVAGMAVALLSMPAMAATQYYVAHAPNQKVCQVVQTKPDGKKMIEAGKTYSTMAAANSALRNLAACH